MIVFGCLWGISQISRLVGTQLGGAPILKIVALVLALLLLLYAFCWVFGSFIGVIRWALDRIAYALGVILFNAAVVSGVFVSAGLVAALTRASASRSRLQVWWATSVVGKPDDVNDALTTVNQERMRFLCRLVLKKHGRTPGCRMTTGSIETL